jgi:hypothetical protein
MFGQIAGAPNANLNLMGNGYIPTLLQQQPGPIAMKPKSFFQHPFRKTDPQIPTN